MPPLLHEAVALVPISGAKTAALFPEAITHPVLADTSHSISRAFDVLREQAGIAYRASVVIDDTGIVRAFHVNDVKVGRSPAEVLRTVRALKIWRSQNQAWWL